MYEKKHMESLRKKYPTMMRILHDERNENMAKEIIKASERHEKMIAVVGDAHVTGLIELLPDNMEIRTVRLAEIRDEEKVSKIMADIWYDRFE